MNILNIVKNQKYLKINKLKNLILLYLSFKSFNIIF